MTTALSRALAADPTRPHHVGLVRPTTCQARLQDGSTCGGRVVCNWACDYDYPDGHVGRVRVWHCLRHGGSYLEPIEDSREAERTL